jgi:hypothetical protein
MSDGGGDSLLAQLLAAVVTILAAIGGYISSQVLGHSREIATMRQNLADLRETIARLHSEAMSRHGEVVRRLEVIEHGVTSLSLKVEAIHVRLGVVDEHLK